MADQPDDEKEAGSEDQSDQEKKDDKDKSKTSDSKDKKNDKSGGKNDDGDKKDDDKKDKKPRSRWPLIIAAIVVVVIVIAGIIYWLATAGEISTDDAYTEGNAVSIASNVAGYVTALDIDDNTYVHAGDHLLTIDARSDQASVEQAGASLTLARAQLADAETNLTQTEVKAPAQLEEAKSKLVQAEAQEENDRRNYNRQHEADQRATTASNVDQATEELRSAQASTAEARAEVAAADLVPQMVQSAEAQVAEEQAQVASDEANLAQARVKLSYNEITAPQDGWITMRSVDLGTYVQAGQQIFYIVAPKVWIVANYKETQLAHMKLGQFVTIKVDQFPSLTLHGHVESFQQGSGDRFSAFPAENATGNFVKIVRRVPVKIVIDTGMPPNLHSLPLGISVEPTVHEP